MENILYNNYRNSRILNVLLFIAVIFLLFYACGQHQKAMRNQAAQNIIEKYIEPDTLKLTPAQVGSDTFIAKRPEAVVPPLKSDPVYRTIIEYFDSASKSSASIKDRVPEIASKSPTFIYGDTSKFIKTIDSLKNVIRYSSVSYENPYLTFTPAQQLSDSARSQPKYNYNAKINAEQLSITKKYLGMPIGKKKSYVQLTSLDTNATINGLRVYRSSINEPRYGLRIQAVLGYNFSTQSPTFGPAFRMDIGRFSISNSYPYNFKLRRSTYAVSVTGDLIRF